MKLLFSHAKFISTGRLQWVFLLTYCHKGLPNTFSNIVSCVTVQKEFQ